MVGRILITGARAPVALHLARCCRAGSVDAVLADSFVMPISRATDMAYVRLPGPRGHLGRYGQAVLEACLRHDIDLIIPTCEEVFYLAAARDLLGMPLPVLAAPFDQLAEVHNKFSFSNISTDLGADTPPTRLLTSQSDLNTVPGGQWVYKPVWSRFGDRVLICPSAKARERINPTPDDPWIAQAYLPGEELCAYGVAFEGKLMALSIYRPLYRAGQGSGAGVMVEPVKDTTVDEFVSGFMARLNWQGQVAFDFRRDQDGRLHVIECNPRAVTGAQFFAEDDGLVFSLTQGRPSHPSVQGALGSGLGMWLYGYPQARREATLPQWRRDYQRMKSLLDSPYDRPTWPYQLAAFSEIALRALFRGQGLKAAATADIEWNGEPLL